MPATGESMGMGAGASMPTDKMDMGSNVKVIGLLGFGLTLILLGLGLLPYPYNAGFAGNWPAMKVAYYFGGLALAILGLFAVYRGSVYWGSVFLGFGAFFLVWATTNAPLGSTAAAAYGFAAIFFVFLLMTLTFLITSMKHGWMTFFFFLFLFISLILWIVESWMAGAGNTISDGQMWATGGLTILTGLIGWYTATATLANWTYGRKLLPG